MAAKKTNAKKDKARGVTVRDLSNSDWWRLSRVYWELFPQLGKLTRKTLTEARENGELRCVRLLNSGQTKPAGAKFWRSFKAAHERHYFDRPDKYDPDVYVRRPWEVLPVPAPPHAIKENEPEESERGKPGPHAEWQWFVAGKYYTEKYNDRQAPNAPQLADLCRDRFGYRPAPTAINKLLRELRKILG
jgi:hypothetical protein